MNPREVEKLLGGYASGTLTDVEREALFSEALKNQSLFDAVADEEALRELLSDPAAKRRLLAVLEPKPSFWSILWSPAPLAALSSVAVAVVLFVAMRSTEIVSESEPTVSVARTESPKPFVAPAPRSTAPALIKEPFVVDQPAGKQPSVPGVPPISTPPIPPPPAKPAPEQLRQEEEKERAVGQQGQGQGGGQGAGQGQGQTVGPDGRVIKDFAAPQATAGAADAVAPSTVRPQEARSRADTKEPTRANPAAPSPSPVAIGSVAKTTNSALAEADEKKKETGSAPRFERRVSDGVYAAVADPLKLKAGEEVRMVLTALQAGIMTVSVDGQTIYQANVAAGREYTIPMQGGLPSQPGDRVIVVAFGAGRGGRSVAASADNQTIRIRFE
jgi:hypothetical protein